MTTFSLDSDQIKKFEEWRAGRSPNTYAGASGGRWTFSFTPTSLGVVATVTDGMLDKATLDLSKYEDW